MLTFDQNVPVGNGESVDPGYGDQVITLDDAGFEYGADGGFTPRISLDYGPAGAGPALWDTSYGDLTNVLYQSLLASPTLEITLSADPGFLVRLSAFDLAAADGRFGSDPTINSLRVLDGSGTVLLDKNGETVSKTGRNHYQFSTPLEGQSLTIRIDSSNLGADAEGIGIDNITFGQTAERSLPFRAPVPISLGAGIVSADATGLSLADLDNDGDKDLLLVAGGTISWLENTEDDTGEFEGFAPPEPIVANAGAEVSDAVAADLDGDGVRDILAIDLNGATSHVFWVENLAVEEGADFGDPLTNRLPISVPGAASGAISIEAADIDGDGDPDALVPDNDNVEILWYANPGSSGAGWTENLVYGGVDEEFRYAHAAEVDPNGRIDVISASDDGFFWYRNQGAGEFSAFRNAMTSGQVDGRRVATGDLNRDGLIDAVTVECDGAVRFRPLEFAEGWVFDTFSAQTLGDYLDCPDTVAVADVDGDGKLDVVAGSSGPDGELLWFRNIDGDDFSGGQTIPGAPKSIVELLVEDIDLDGDQDVIFASAETDTVGWIENRKIHRSSRFSGRSFAIAGSGRFDIVAGDFNRDGLPDVASGPSDSDLSVVWQLNDGGGGFASPEESVAAVSGFKGIAAGDVNGDGFEDLMVVTRRDLNLFASETDPFAFPGFDPPQTLGSTFECLDFFTNVELADVDGDGDLDAVTGTSPEACAPPGGGAPAGGFGGTARWHINPGSTGLPWPAEDQGFAWDDDITAIRVADLNTDGTNDMLVGTSRFDGTSGEIAWYGGYRLPRAVGESLEARSFDDTAANFVFVTNNLPFTDAGRVTKWSFYDDDDSGKSVTPVIFDDQLRVRGIGTTRQSDGSGLQEFEFAAVAGDANVAPGWFYGWKDGSPDNDEVNDGVIDQRPLAETATDGAEYSVWGDGATSPELVLEQRPDDVTYNFRTIPDRDYSVRFDYDLHRLSVEGSRSIGIGVRDLAVADFDRDGRPDFAAVTQDSLGQGQVLWAKRDGCIVGCPLFNYEAPIEIDAVDDLTSVEAKDVDGDGDPDIVVGRTMTSPTIITYINAAGDASEWVRSDAPQSRDIEDIDVADFDGDGDLDLLVADEDRASILRNDGGQYSISVEDIAPGIAYEGQAVPVLAIRVATNARTGDSIARLSQLEFRFGDFCDGFCTLSAGEANAAFSSLRVYRDLGAPGVFDPEDEAIGEITSFGSATNTVVPFAGAGSSLRISDAATFFVVVEPADGGAAVSFAGGGFAVRHLGDSGALLDAETGLPLVYDGFTDDTTSDSVSIRASFQVDSTADEPDDNLGDGLCQTASLECTLRAAFMEAAASPANHRIELQAATYILGTAGADENSSATGDLDVQSDEISVTVVGAGIGQTIIDGAGNDRLFHVDFGGWLTLRGLTLTGGSAAQGGAILNDSGTVIIEDSEITENTATSQGSAIWTDSTTEIFRSTISRNTTNAGGQAAIWSNGDLLLEDSTLWGNEADDTGGIYVNSDSEAVLVRTTVSGNTAIGEAGGLRTGGTLALFSTTVADNEGTVGGGIVVNSGGSLQLSNSIVAENTATAGPDISNGGGGPVNSSGFNLIGDDGGLTWSPSVGDQTNVDPDLQALADIGAPTLTHALGLASAGLDGGDCTASGREPIDLPSVPNASDGCDIGGFETPIGQTVPRIEIPIRWCGVAGAPSIDNPPPGLNANDVMRLRHERASDNTWIPQANVKFRSAANIPAPNYPILADPNTSIGQPGDVAIKPEILEYDEFHQLVAECRAQWQALDPDIVGITAVHIRKFVDAETGVDLDILGLGGRANPNNILQQMVMGRVMVIDDEFRRNASPPDTLEVLLAHELGHAGSLGHGDGKDNDANQAIDDNDDQFDDLPRFDGPNIMQYRNGNQLTVGQILQFRDHVQTTIPEAQPDDPVSTVAVDSSQIDPAIANVFDFGFANVFDFGFANVFDFGFANVFDFGFANVFDFGFANVFDFGFANVFDFGFANVFDFGMEFQGDETTGSTTVFNSVGGLGWPSPVRPDTSYFFYLNVDPEAVPATGGIPSEDTFPAQVAGVTGPGEQIDVDLILELAIGADCDTSAICTDTQELFIYEYNPTTELFDQLTVPGAMAEEPEEISVGLYRELGNGEIVEEEQGIAASFQATIPNSLLVGKGWQLGEPLAMQAIASVDCTGSVEEGSLLICADSPDLPPGVDPTQIVATSPKNTLEFELPVLPSCEISSATAGAGSTLTVTGIAFPEFPEDPDNPGIPGPRRNFEIYFDTSEVPFFTTAAPPVFNQDGTVDFVVTIPEDAQAGTREISVVQDGRGTSGDCFVDLLTCSDFDGDGECDAVDFDDDGDGVDDIEDIEALNPNVCGDSDLDTCDDCSQAGQFAPGTDGLDTGSDGACTAGDDDDDGDTILDGADLAPLDSSVCGDSDGDSCDDCSVANTFAPANDGLDTDSDGRCNPGDDDDDSDTIPDAVDPDPLDSSVCGDSDGDTCDDCSQTNEFNPSDDGPDPDSDGLCSAGDGIWFATYTTHPIVGQTLFRQTVYRIAPESESVDPVTSGFLSSAANLIALDVKANGNILFAVESAVTVPNGNKTIRLLPGVIYRWNGTKIKVKLKPSSVGVALSTLNALDQVGGNYYFSVDANKTLRVDGIRYRLFPSQVWRLNPNGSPKLELVRGFSQFGFDNVDGVDVLPDGRIAISSQENGTGYGVFDENIYIWDPATDRVELSYRLSTFQVDDSAGFTLLGKE